MAGSPLALTVYDMCQKDLSLLSKPVTTLAKMAGLNVAQVYEKLLPQLAGKKLEEAIKFADVALRYAQVVDRNRLRDECGPEFIQALDMVIKLVGEGLKSSEPWIQRKAISLHGVLIDETQEKQRFLEAISIDDRIAAVEKSKKNIEKLRSEILEFNEKEGIYESRGDI
jgi:hypothetical protein